MESAEEYQVATNYSETGRDLLNGGLINFTLIQRIFPTQDHQTSVTFFCSKEFRFGWYTILTGATCLLGLAGNTLSIVILQQDRGNKVANLLLQALAVADNALLITSFLMLSVIWGSLEFFNAQDAFMTLHPYFLVYVQPIGYMTKTSAIGMTVLLAINRYVVIKKPLEASHTCTMCRARLQIVAVLLFSIVCNIPRFFQHRLVRKKDGVVAFEESGIGKGSVFHIIYTNVFYTTLVIILPLILLIFMNVSLIRELKKVRHQRKQMNVHVPQPSDQNITLVMCIIIVIFIACHTPDRILQGTKSFLGNNWWTHSCYLSAICNLLIVINSSINFLVYYFVRKRFRNLLVQTLCATFARQPVESSRWSEYRHTQHPEAKRPMIALRRLSTSVARLLNNQVETNDTGSAELVPRKRTRSLESFTDVCDVDRPSKSHSAHGLLKMTKAIEVPSNTRSLRSFSVTF